MDVHYRPALCSDARTPGGSVSKSILPGFRRTRFNYSIPFLLQQPSSWMSSMSNHTNEETCVKAMNKTSKTHPTGCWGALFEASKTKSFSGSPPPRGEWNVMCSRSSSTERHRNDRQCLREREMVLAGWSHSQALHEHLGMRVGHWECYAHKGYECIRMLMMCI